MEKSRGAAEGIARPTIAVAQPQKLESLLDTINLINTVSERIGESRSGDLGGGGGSAAAQTGAQAQSWRDQALANLPAAPVMQQQLQKHIEQEIADLQREVQKTARKAARPGAAHKLNELYARIRRLNGLLQQLFETSVDILKRLYVRVFIDKQTVL